ncbi:hypothetical protein ACM64Y_01985 [Novispirillum sp. DQ9]|uniref:hypothetical protein n=1 Tax=Novispirillum sp. DQ9 TaxID=3398612 RepID=UPI003C7E2103
MSLPARPLRVAAAITPHGFGHAAITLAVLDALHGLLPQGLDVTFITRLPADLLRTRWGRPCQIVDHAAASDFGMLMTSSTGVRVRDSVAAYTAAHEHWDDVLAREAAVLAEARPDVLLSCISYAALAAARRLGVPAVGVGPFTWHEILSAYAPEAVAILDTMRAAYAAADAIIATSPAVPMTFANLRAVGPVGRPGLARRRDLTASLGVGEDCRLALVALGGIAEDVPVADWPSVAGWRWVVPDEVAAAGMSISDAIASCDAVITKPGYGTFVEAACAGTPILYRDRPDWPETAGLAAWLARVVPCIRIDAETFSRGALADHLHMLAKPRAAGRPLGAPEGNRQAAGIIIDILTGRARP